jgi:hypothetical protein
VTVFDRVAVAEAETEKGLRGLLPTQDQEKQNQSTQAKPPGFGLGQVKSKLNIEYGSPSCQCQF